MYKNSVSLRAGGNDILQLTQLMYNGFYYSPGVHRIVMALPGMMPPSDPEKWFYHLTPELPPAVNYGIIGSIYGHEMGHAIQNDDDRLMESQQDNIMEKHACLVDFYADKAHSGIKQRMSQEAISDAIGVKHSYDAYIDLPDDELTWVLEPVR